MWSRIELYLYAPGMLYILLSLHLYEGHKSYTDDSDLRPSFQRSNRVLDLRVNTPLAVMVYPSAPWEQNQVVRLQDDDIGLGLGPRMGDQAGGDDSFCTAFAGPLGHHRQRLSCIRNLIHNSHDTTVQFGFRKSHLPDRFFGDDPIVLPARQPDGIHFLAKHAGHSRGPYGC